MARYTDHDVAPILAAIDRWKIKCLLSDGSIFSSDKIWTSENLEQLNQHFVLNPDLSKNKGFLDKLKRQLAPTSSGAKQLVAEMLWVIFTFPSRGIKPSTKRNQIREVWSWSGVELDESNAELGSPLEFGVGGPGQAYNQRRWEELAYLIGVVRKWKTLPLDEQKGTVGDPWKFGAWLDEQPNSDRRQLRHVLLYLMFPDSFERMATGGDKEDAYDAFANLLKGAPPSYREIIKAEGWLGLDKRLFEIRKLLEKQYETPDLDFYYPPLRAHWKHDAVEEEEEEEEEDTDIGPGHRFWIEKTHVSGRKDRETGPHALGQALWSPQKSKSGGNIYRSMREVQPNDVVLHLVDDSHISGVSLVANTVDDQFDGIPGTAWEGPGFRVQLRDFVTLDPTLERNDFFGVPEFADKLREIRKKHKNLFYTRDLELNQGAYLTSAPLELVGLLNQAYVNKSGKSLPHCEMVAIPTNSSKNKAPIQPAYTIDDFAKETWIELETIEQWRNRLQRKQHLVFQGPPVTGKTFVAEKLAKLLVAGTPGIIELIQFHPSWGYEDFIEGIRPKLVQGVLSYELLPGRFLNFCTRVKGLQTDAPCVMIVDEMNRANLSRVFGELMYLLEYRDKSISLAQGEQFKIPGNVFIIGTMNTADRSIALVDHALRRRFSFIHIGPSYSVLQKYLFAHDLPVEGLINALRMINAEIANYHYELGISFFMKDGANLRKSMRGVWQGEIEPYLEEYFYDRPEKAAAFKWEALANTGLKDWASN
jgi:AAA domain (dynein-related subfamily)